MHKYIIKRLLMMIPVILGVTFIVFSIMEISPGNPAKIMLGQRATQEQIDKLNDELGYNDPFLIRYVRYIGNAIQGDLGKSYKTKAPVAEEIVSRLPVTFKLALGCTILAILVAIPLGINAAVKQYSFMDTLTTAGALILASIPDFWLGMLLVLLFSLKLDLLPATGADNFSNYILPVLTLSAYSVAVFTRMTRSTMLDVIRQDYIRTAKAKGANRHRIIRKHALKNAMIPVVTAIGMDIAALLGGTVLIETVYGMPGVGTLIITSIRNKDIPTVMGSVIFLAIVASVINLLVDISYAYIDPRIKAQYKGK